MQSIPHSQHTNYINTANTVANNSIKSMRLSILWEKLSIFCWLISTLIKTKKKSCNFMLHALLLHRLVIESQMRLWGTFVIETIVISLPKKRDGNCFFIFQLFSFTFKHFSVKIIQIYKTNRRAIRGISRLSYLGVTLCTRTMLFMSTLRSNTDIRLVRLRSRESMRW